MSLLEEAAVCMVAMSKEPPCSEDPIKEELCVMMCCCIKYPVLKSKRLMQSCANLLMDATNSLERGYENSVPYSMDTKEPLPIDPRTGGRIWREVKQWAGDDTARTGKVRIPDVTVYGEHGTPDYVYEMKFPGDYWRNNQYEDYVELKNGDKCKVKELNKDECDCDGRKEDRKKLTEKEKRDIAEMARQYFIADWEANKTIIAGTMAGYDDQELIDLCKEISSAVHNAKTFAEKMAPLTDPTLLLPWGRLGRLGKMGGAAGRAGGRLPGPGLPPPGWNPAPVPVK
jgi:hypothetical protein